MNESKVALITGATRGIGKEIALELARNGFDIAVNCRNKKEVPDELKQEIESNKVRCEFVEADVANFEQCENMVKEAIEKFGRIDVLVNNAGITKDGLIMRMKKEDFEQ